MGNEFNSIDELYKRILPALKHKKRELIAKGIKKEEKEIFDELSKKWSKEDKLTLFDIVKDILSYK